MAEPPPRSGLPAAPASIPGTLTDSLHARYSGPERHYHSWVHVEALLRHFRRWEAHFHRPVPVLWALYWHDAIYDPQAKDNEERSAVLLEREAQGHLPPVDIALAARIVRATTAHTVPEGLSAEDVADTALFLDLDLSILGAPAQIYDRYESDIRKEYAFVPEDAFRAGRGAILKGFLARERLYLTDLAHDDWDGPARVNLARAIAALDGA